MMNTETMREKLLDLVIARLRNISLDHCLVWTFEKWLVLWSLLNKFNEFHRSVVSSGSLMYKNHDLLPHLEDSKKIIEDDVIHHIIESLGVSELFYPIKGAFKRSRTEA